MNARIPLVPVAMLFIVLFYAGNALGQAAGRISADPNPCTIAQTASTCNITISWNVTGASTAIVTVQDGDGDELDFASGLTGSKVLTGQAPPHRYSLRLYDTSGGNLTWLDGTVVLVMGSGTLFADPNPCVVTGGSSTCTTMLTWSTSNVSKALLTMRDMAGGPETAIAYTLSGSQPATLLASHQYLFKLYDVSSPDSLQITAAGVIATGTGGIAANPDPCPVLTGSSTCTTAVTWNTQNVASAQVIMQDSQAPSSPVVVGTALSGTYSAVIQPPPHIYSFTLYDTSTGNLVWLGATGVVATGTGILTATPTPCPIPSGSSTCNASVNWSTNNVASAEVTQQDMATTVETSFATGTSGSKPVTLSGPANYMFRLYDNSSGFRMFLNAFGVTVGGTGAIIASPNPCIIATGVTSCSTTVTWSTTGVTAAEVTKQDSVGGGEVIISSALSGSLPATIAGPPHAYLFTLYDVSTGNRVYLASWGVMAAAAPNGAPSNLTAAFGTNSNGKKRSAVVKLAWMDNSTNETAFYVERCTGTTCTNFGLIAVVAANSAAYTDTGVVSRTVYRYRVRAFNSYGFSPYSNIANSMTSLSSGLQSAPVPSTSPLSAPRILRENDGAIQHLELQIKNSRK